MALIRMPKPPQPHDVGGQRRIKGLATQVSEKPHFFFKGVDSRQKAAMLDANPELQKATLPKAKPWTTEGHHGLS